jgi:hypothetical protein
MEQNKIIAKLLRRLADIVEHSAPAELEELLAGQPRLLISKEGPEGFRRSVRRDLQTKKRASVSNLYGVVDQVRQLESREQGLDFLRSAQLNKIELERLARLMDLPVRREDDADRLRQMIVEASIGSRLNSRAIRGD